MGPGINAIEDLRATEKLSVEKAFNVIFPGRTFASSTYGDHRRYWKLLSPKEQEDVISAKRTLDGEWSVVVKKGKSRR